MTQPQRTTNPRPQRIVRPCQRCGAMMALWPCLADKQRFCSRACKCAASRKPKTCRECGKEYYYRIGSGKQFCSRACHSAYRHHSPTLHTEETKRKLARMAQGRPGLRGEANPQYRHGLTARVEKACPSCGKTFTAPGHKLYCSKRCADEALPAKLQAFYASPAGQVALLEHSRRSGGKRNANWRGGVSLLPYGPDFTRTLVRAIRQRDAYACRRCGAMGRQSGGLITHHIDGGKSNHSLENLVTLCRRCHGIVHWYKLDASAYLP